MQETVHFNRNQELNLALTLATGKHGIKNVKFIYEICGFKCSYILVVPDLYILVDGNTSNLTKALNLMQEYQFDCVAVGSRPITPLQLIINGLSVSHNTTETYNENRFGTSNSSIRITHRVDTNVIRIECETEAQYINGNKSVSTELNGKERVGTYSTDKI